jgi:acyl-CoA reductase-like NAD-dependent aldehyde dehydrogenase
MADHRDTIAGLHKRDAEGRTIDEVRVQVERAIEKANNAVKQLDHVHTRNSVKGNTATNDSGEER